MHKLIDYICDELEELEKKAEKGKLTATEIQYMDTLAHAKKNLLKGEEMMSEVYSMADDRSYRGSRSYRDPYMMSNNSYARGRGRNAKRDSMGRYSSERGRSYYDGMSYADDMKEMAESIYEIMDDLPDDVKQDAQRFVKKLEQVR